MAMKTMNAGMLRKMFLAGAANIEAKKEFINELNVFPVPDGESGDGDTCKGNFIWFPQRCKRKFRCYSLSAVPWFHKGDQGV